MCAVPRVPVSDVDEAGDSPLRAVVDRDARRSAESVSGERDERLVRLVVPHREDPDRVRRVREDVGRVLVLAHEFEDDRFVEVVQERAHLVGTGRAPVEDELPVRGGEHVNGHAAPSPVRFDHELATRQARFDDVVGRPHRVAVADLNELPAGNEAVVLRHVAPVALEQPREDELVVECLAEPAVDPGGLHVPRVIGDELAVVVAGKPVADCRIPGEPVPPRPEPRRQRNAEGRPYLAADKPLEVSGGASGFEHAFRETARHRSCLRRCPAVDQRIPCAS